MTAYKLKPGINCSLFICVDFIFDKGFGRPSSKVDKSDTERRLWALLMKHLMLFQC